MNHINDGVRISILYLSDTEAFSGIFAIDLSELWRDVSNKPSPGPVPPSDSWYSMKKEG